MLVPGEILAVEVPVEHGDQLWYHIVCEDGLDVGFTAQLTNLHQDDTQMLETWRAADRRGSLSFASPGSCTLTLDNTHAWLRSKTVHMNIASSSATYSTAVASSVRMEEERELRRAFLDNLRQEEVQLKRKAMRLRRQLVAAEADLERVRHVLAATEATEVAPGLVGASAIHPNAPQAIATDRSLDDAAAKGVDVDVVTSDICAQRDGQGHEAHIGTSAEASDATDDAVSGITTLQALWRKLALMDADAVVEARWLETGSKTDGDMAMPRMVEPHVARDPPVLVLHSVYLHGRKLSELCEPMRSDIALDVLIRGLLEQIANAPLSSLPADLLHNLLPSASTTSCLPKDSGAVSLGHGMPSLPPQPPRALPPELPPLELPLESPSTQQGLSSPASSAPSGSTTTSRSDNDHASTALEKLQLLSKLLLQLDANASMDVSSVSESAYILNEVCIRGRTLRGGFGTITAATDVRQIAEVCDRATMTCGTESLAPIPSNGLPP